ncbi:hypothetical protein RFI_37493, partial [Reticulomyxa filosa]
MNDISGTKIQDIWEKYFNSDSIAKYVLRKVGNNRYQFLHKSCQEYFAAQKIIFDIVSWKSNVITIDNQQFQQQFETYIPILSINKKLIYDTNSLYMNVKSRLFRIIQASKNNPNIFFAAAILNAANTVSTSFKLVLTTQILRIQAYFGEYASFQGYSKGVNSVQFSPDGTKIVSGSSDNTIRLWDIFSGKVLCELKHSYSVAWVQFSSDGSKIISAPRDTTIELWDISSRKLIRSFNGHKDDVNSVHFSPDNSKIVSSSADKTVR